MIFCRVGKDNKEKRITFICRNSWTCVSSFIDHVNKVEIAAPSASVHRIQLRSLLPCFALPHLTSAVVQIRFGLPGLFEVSGCVVNGLHLRSVVVGTLAPFEASSCTSEVQTTSECMLNFAQRLYHMFLSSRFGVFSACRLLLHRSEALFLTFEVKNPTSCWHFT